MRAKILSERTSVIVVLAGLVFSTALLFYFIQKSSTQGGLAPFTENTSALYEQGQENLPAPSVGGPVRLKIPKINLDAAVERVGLTPEGAMDVPKSSDDVAWFELGQRPGENGSAVIDGHYGRKDGKASVFDDLYMLRKGDILYVEDEKGAVIPFVVRGNRRYDPKADASDVFSSHDGKSHLNLITCEGLWDKASQGYPKRLVVFADKE